MAIFENFTLADVGALQEFSSLALGTHNATDEIITAQLNIANPTEALKYEQVCAELRHAYNQKIEYVLRNGVSTDAIEIALREKYRAYEVLEKKHASDPTLKFLDDPIHRKEFNVRPYDIPGKIRPPNPYPGATAAMDGLWPGYDKPEYFTEYPFLERYRGVVPEGKVMEQFLRDHHLFFNFPETVSRYGVLFVPPPYLTNEMNIELRQHLSKCDKLYHTAPSVSPDNTVAEARLVLSYLEDDMVATVNNDGGTCIGVVGWKDLEGRKDSEVIGRCMQKDWNEAPEKEMSPEEAFIYMNDKNRDWPYMLKSTEHGMRIVTRTTASVSHFLAPHIFKEGLGSAIYFGISDVREGNKLITELNAQADGVPAAIVETAHADTPYFRKILSHYRQQLQDVFLMAGTTVDPKAVLDFLLRYNADGVKLGIAEGRACRTSNTGVAPPNAHVGLQCGAAAYGMGYLKLDGWGSSDEFIKGLAMSGIQMRQGGGAFVGRRESANPWLKNGGPVRGKYYRGMAGEEVQQAVLEGKILSASKQMEIAAHLHSEGAEVFVPQRSPSTVGRMLLAHMFLLKSAMSYEGVRAELDPDYKHSPVPAQMREAVLRQFHRMARLYRVQIAV